MENVITRIMNLPWGIKGATVIDEDGDFNMYINAKYGDEKRVYDHEIDHIKNGDFHNGKPICEIEK